MSTTRQRESQGAPIRSSRDLLRAFLRTIARHVTSFYTALGIYFVAGALVAILGTWGFAELAEHVRGGSTLAFDDAVLRWMGAHQVPWIQASLLEITALGTGSVVLMIVAISAVFLALTEHRYSAMLLLVAAAGGLVLDAVLKHVFDRPRPEIFAWGTHAVSSSFPSGHAMSAAIVYSTVALLAARLETRWWMRWLTIAVAVVVIALICVSRLYLGVHYPSDVIGGVVIGVSWAAFCLAGLEGVELFAKRFRPGELRHERDLTDGERRAQGLDR